MAEKNTLILNINPGDGGQGDSKKTAVLPSRQPRRFGRRRIRRGMNFWDLSMVNLGPGHNAWTMLNFQPSACPFGTSSQTFDTTYHEELLDKIFEVPVEEWRTYYKRIVPAMEYPLEVGSRDISGFASSSYLLDGSNPAFTDQGLQVSSDFFSSGKLLGVNLQSLGTVYAFKTQFLQKGASSTTSGCYVTSEYDPTASEVTDFQPKKNCDVFLVPALAYALCRFEHYGAGGTPQHVQQLNEFFYLLDRNIVLDTVSNPLAGVNEFVNFRNTSGSPSEGSQGEYDRFLAVAEYFKTFSNARARYSTVIPAVYTSTDDGSNFGSVLPGTYSYTPPPPDTEGTVHMACSLNGNTANTALIASGDNQILLRAMIYQDGQYYYIWNWENI